MYAVPLFDLSPTKDGPPLTRKILFQKVSPMLVLPAEIQEAIIARTPLRDVLALRTTCKHLKLACQTEVSRWHHVQLLLRRWKALVALRRILVNVRKMSLVNPYDDWAPSAGPEPRRTVYESVKPRLIELVALGTKEGSLVNQEALLTAVQPAMLPGVLYCIYRHVKPSSGNLASFLRKALQHLKLPLRLLRTAGSDFAWCDTDPAGGREAYKELTALIEQVQLQAWQRSLRELPQAVLRVAVAAANANAIACHIDIEESLINLPWFWTNNLQA